MTRTKREMVQILYFMKKKSFSGKKYGIVIHLEGILFSLEITITFPCTDFMLTAVLVSRFLFFFVQNAG